jgi:cell division septum initiation protein DivIVA
VDDDVAAPVSALLDRLQTVVEDARAMPMSASCVVNRTEVLGLIADLRSRLPETLSRASAVLGDRSGVVAGGKAEADELLEAARQERNAMLARSEVHKRARKEAEELLAEARSEADAIRAEVEDYVDSKLANFEIVLSKTLGAVQRGRARLHGESEMDELGEEELRPLPG